jgi:hypothetical protein
MYPTYGAENTPDFEQDINGLNHASSSDTMGDIPSNMPPPGSVSPYTQTLPSYGFGSQFHNNHPMSGSETRIGSGNSNDFNSPGAYRWADTQYVNRTDFGNDFPQAGFQTGIQIDIMNNNHIPSFQPAARTPNYIWNNLSHGAMGPIPNPTMHVSAQFPAELQAQSQDTDFGPLTEPLGHPGNLPDYLPFPSRLGNHGSPELSLNDTPSKLANEPCISRLTNQ